MSDARIVLVKPGDVLILGNVTLPPDGDALETFHVSLGKLRETLGLEHILVFEDDIDLAVQASAEVRYEVHHQTSPGMSDDELLAVARRHDASARVGRFT
jgi:hypothetical protein